MSESKSKIVRPTRLSIDPNLEIELKIGEDVFLLANISYFGLAFFVSDQRSFTENERATGVISLEKTSLEIEFEVVHQAGKIAGCKVLGPIHEYSEFIHHFFDGEIEGLNMAEVNFDNVRQDPRGKTRWWNGGDGLDLRLIVQGEKVVQFEITFRGNLFEGGLGRPVRIWERPIDFIRFTDYANSYTMDDLKAESAHVKRTLRKFVESMNGLEGHWKQKILAHIL